MEDLLTIEISIVICNYFMSPDSLCIVHMYYDHPVLIPAPLFENSYQMTAWEETKKSVSKRRT